MKFLTSLLLSTVQVTFCTAELNQFPTTVPTNLNPYSALELPRRWVSLPTDLDKDGSKHSAGFLALADERTSVRRRQNAASITTPALSSPTASYDDSYEAPPSLAPVRSDLEQSLSSLDSSLDSQISSVIQEMTTAQCVGVPDVNGTPVTLCGPTAANASPAAATSTDIAAAKGKGLAGGLILGLAGAFVV